MPNFPKRALIGVAAAGISVMAFAFPASAATPPPADFNVQAWAEKHADNIKLYLGVDVHQCKGLQGLTYEKAVDLAKAKHVDLDALVSKNDPDAMLRAVKDAGITFADLRGMLDAFCASTPAGPPAKDPGKSDEPHGKAPEHKPDSPGKSGEEHGEHKAKGHEKKDDALAKTGSEVDPWLLGGASAMVVGSGAGLVALTRKRSRS